MRSSRAALLAVLVAVCALPAAPAGADHVVVKLPPPPPREVATAHPAPAPLPPRIGPPVRVRRTVAPGAPVYLPKVDGRVRIVCTGPAMRGALVWLERGKDGRTAVKRYDGGREYDFVYRVVQGSASTARERCPR